MKGNLGPRRSWEVLGGHGKPKEVIGCILPWDIGGIQALEFLGLRRISNTFLIFTRLFEGKLGSYEVLGCPRMSWEAKGSHRMHPAMGHRRYSSPGIPRIT